MPKVRKAAVPNNKQESALQSMGATLWQAADKLRKNMDAAEYKHVVPGFCKSVSLAEIREKEYVLTPGRYIGLPEDEDDFDLFPIIISARGTVGALAVLKRPMTGEVGVRT